MSYQPDILFPGFSRRNFLQIGALGGLGLSLADVLKMEANAAQKHYETREGVAKSVIHIHVGGGMSAQETFDPKPHAPFEYRGPFGTVKTAIPGVEFSEGMTHTAKIADKITVIRSMNHGDAEHGRGTHNMFTGYKPSPALRYPSIGSVVSHEMGPRNGLPPYICVPNPPGGGHAGSGYLNPAYGPFSLGSDPSSRDFKVRDLIPPKEVDADRFAKRRSTLEYVDSHFRELEKSDTLDALDGFYHDAYRLMSSQAAREAFDFRSESKETRDRYGVSGARMLLARRMVEAGVRFVSMSAGGAWDHHGDIRAGINNTLPSLDQSYAALIADLDERGLLDSTLVVLSTEFGRTPKINAKGGRDHWPRVFSVALAGGGVQQGMVHGAADPLGNAVQDDEVSAADLAKTIYHQIGINAEKELMSPGDRPIEIVDGGKVVQKILAKS